MIMQYKIRLSSLFLAITAITFMLYGGNSSAELCSKWSEGKKAGVLDHNLINEASGVEASRKFPGRLYHINDSGGGHFFYISDVKGDQTKKIRIDGKAIKKSDFEAVSVGKCFDKSCLFIGDIGDNTITKDSVEIIVIEELEDYETSIEPLYRIKFQYPDQPHNAEGMALHPNGDIYIITKEENLRDLEAYPAKVFKLPAEKWQQKGNTNHKLIYVGDIDLRIINPSGTAYGQVVSSLDISPDGKKFMILTYENAIEFNIDLSNQKIKPTAQLQKGIDYNLIDIKSLPQQESIAYLQDGKAFLYNTEYHWFEAPIMRVDCLDH
ncbi:MAG: hypothetical protein DHS20C13_19400 [Thermodesulfobacteriota bacterium]|nr:MAG: hypothetical protein DHS20C13_19400 [Thermodesulfobacteriota bacterium]